MATNTAFLGGIRRENVAAYLADFPVGSSSPSAPVAEMRPPQIEFPPHFLERIGSAGVVDASESELRSATKRLREFLEKVPDADMSATGEFSTANAAREKEEPAAKGMDVITYQHINTFLLGLLNVAVIGFGIVFWDSFTTVRDDVGDLQKDVTAIKVQSAETNGKLDKLDVGLNGKLDTMAANNAGQLQLISQQLADLRQDRPQTP